MVPVNVRTAAAKQDLGNAVSMLIAPLPVVPPAMQAMAGSMIPNAPGLFNLVCTKLPGPQIPLYIAGRKVEELWPLVPLSAGMGLNVCLTSYNGVLYWGICADPNLVPDVDCVANLVRESFDQLKEAATAASAVPA